MAQPTWKQLARYFEGRSSLEESAEIRRWIEAKPSHAAFVEDLRRVWSAAGEDRTHWDVEAAVARLTRRTRSRIEADAIIPTTRGRRSGDALTQRRPRQARSRQWLSAAAGIAALIGTGILGTMLIRGEWRDPGVAAAVTFPTGKGQRKTFDLPDGSRVVLNVESELTIAPGFGDEERNVVLRGGAYFEVAPDSSKPFIVRAGETTTRVLGTRFGVRAYPDDDDVQVVVAEGRVALSPTERGGPDPGAPEVTAGQIGVVLAGRREVAVRNVDPALHLSWIEGRLVFQDIPLDDVLGRLEQWYDVDLEAADPGLGARKFTGTLAPGTQSIGEVLGALALTLDATYRVDDRTVVFRRKP